MHPAIVPVAIQEDLLLNASEQQYIHQHLSDDINELLLKAKGNERLKFLLTQIARRQKIKSKLPEIYHDLQWHLPMQVSLEQCSSEKTAKFKSSLFSGKCMIDLTLGMGVDAYYFAQRFSELYVIEQSNELSAISAHNLAGKGLAKTVSIGRGLTAEQFLQQFTGTADLLYVDPHRRDQTGGKVFRLADCVPDVCHLLPALRKASHNVLIKTSPLLDITLACEQLQGVQNVYVLSSEGDCKELLFHLPQQPAKAMQIHAVDLDGAPHFTFTWAEEKAMTISYGLPERFIYEPNASLLKAGAFKILTDRFPVQKLHRHSHLYTSSKRIADFPGRVFEIEQIVKPERNALHAIVKNGKANLAIRNFPGTVAELKKKWNLSDGGEYYLFATTLFDEQKVILVCKKTMPDELL